MRRNINKASRLLTSLFISLMLSLLLMFGQSGLAPAYAHQQKEAYITLLFNKNSGLLEISHRFLIHDAEHVFGKLFDTQTLNLSGDLLNDKNTQAAFAAYVESQFSLADEAQSNLPISSVGHEIDGKFLWVYQETPIPNIDRLLIKHRALHELWPNQINHINVERNGAVRSVRLQKRDDGKWSTVELPKSTIK